MAYNFYIEPTIPILNTKEGLTDEAGYKILV